MLQRKKRLSEDLLHKVKAVVERDSARRVAARWGMDRDTLARALAGFEVQGGTIAEIKLGLQGEEIAA